MDASTFTPEYFKQLGRGTLVSHLGIEISAVGADALVAELTIGAQHLAPNGFLHAGTVVSLADTACGYACVANLPQGAHGFTTIELKSNHLGTAREGAIVATAKAVHLGRSTQVWDAIVSNKETGKTIALFRCTQMILYPK
jgi:uncharacterized protein (TIGR00369 family)